MNEQQPWMPDHLVIPAPVPTDMMTQGFLWSCTTYANSKLQEIRAVTKLEFLIEKSKNRK